MQSIKGGVTLVQVREKKTDTGEVRNRQLCEHSRPTTLLSKFIEVAKATKAICRKYNVPVLINDRIDVALAIGADGVHLGQTDMPVDVARKLLPPNAIIGMTCNTADHVRQAIKDRVDYVGLGPVWHTDTKKVNSPVVGVRGIGELLELLETSTEGRHVKAVSIGVSHGF